MPPGKWSGLRSAPLWLGLLFSCLLGSQAVAQERFLDFRDRLLTLEASERPAAAAQFVAAAKPRGLPLIEGMEVTFLYQTKASAVFLAGDFNGWDPTATPMEQLPGTELFYHRQQFDPAARLDYKFVEGGKDWKLDPWNPRTCLGGYGPNSELAMPNYLPPPELVPDGQGPRGKLVEAQLASRATRATYPVTVYLPPGYEASSQRFPVVYFQDGGDYIRFGSALTVLDNAWRDSFVAPVIAVFVSPTDRNNEYVFRNVKKYERFFVEELVPWVDSHYRTLPAPKQRLLVGDSFGASISARLAWNHPALFGAVALHSPALWPQRHAMQRRLLQEKPRPVRFWAAWGSYELLHPEARAQAEALQRGLPERGLELSWREYPQGHSWGLWRGLIDNALAWAFPGSSWSADIDPRDSQTRPESNIR